MHVAAFVIAFGLVLWLAVFFIDYGYYYTMLIGSVQRGWQIDDAFDSPTLFGDLRLRLFGSAREISRAIGPEGASKYFVVLFYGFVYLAGLLYLLGVMTLLDCR